MDGDVHLGRPTPLRARAQRGTDDPLEPADGSHSPEPHSFKPVLSTNRCMGSPSLRGRGTSSVSARQHRVKWSGTARVSPSRWTMEPIRPSVCRSARRNTARSVSAVRIARGEYQRCPPRVGRGSARHASTASFVNQTVEAAALAQAGIIRAPVRDLVLLSWNAVAAVVVQFEWQVGAQAQVRGSLHTPGLFRTPLGGFMQHSCSRYHSVSGLVQSLMSTGPSSCSLI